MGTWFTVIVAAHTEKYLISDYLISDNSIFFPIMNTPNKPSFYTVESLDNCSIHS